MQLVTITSQGQITLPIYLRQKYNFDIGNKVLIKEENNKVVVEPVPDVFSLAGSLNRYAKKDISFEEIAELETKGLERARSERYEKKRKNEGLKLFSIRP